ncbi:transcription factor 7-like 1-B [Corythoichthys intestinalis]|uniref:transcription factor 7-like 1-B n=1 Tax=Corythoichthys intestinalis TaxID=161448 RepID=UPI0025A6825C|nr:transcription factor 7-like 1-B [Corythoichthys intestinalis]
MVYAKEQRPFLKIIYADKDSGTVSKLLGQMWQTLTVGDKIKYFEVAQRLEQEHAIKYPNWSVKDNYGKSKRTKRSNAASCMSHHPTATLVAAYPAAATPVGAFPVAATPVTVPPIAAYPVAAYPVTGYPAAAYPVAAFTVGADQISGYLASATTARTPAPTPVAAPVTNPPPSSSDLAAELTMPPSLEQEFTELLEELANQPFDQWPDLHIDPSLFDL